jgi:hypothetical protein
MIDEAFVKACRGDTEPGEVTPLSYLRTAIVTLQDLDTAIAEREEDPDAFDAMITELYRLEAGLKEALAAHDHHVKVVKFSTALQRGPAPGELRSILDAK